MALALKKLQKVSGGGFDPILGSVFITAKEDGKLALCATNLHSYLKLEVEAAVEKAGSAAVPLRTLAAMVSLLGEEVAFNLKNNVLQISSNEARFELKSLNAADFPPAPPIGVGSQFAFEGVLFRQAVESVKCAVCPDEDRVLNGVLVEFKGSCVNLVACDGRRLSMRTLEMAAPCAKAAQVVMPLQIVKEFGVVLPEATLLMTLGSKVVGLSWKGGELRFAAKDASYPDYRRVLPKELECVFQVERGVLLETLDRVAVVSKEGDWRVGLVLGGSQIKVVAKSPDFGGYQGSFPAVGPKGSFKVVFDSRYLRDAVMGANSEKVEFGLSKDRVGMIKSEGFVGVISSCKEPAPAR